ncbi:hypothetical protein [Shewanella halifaxensis]|uniref:hypothetical protein n=1 Tax=Shewanella halifaxensis TaxID=271098 RepID=UPI0013A6654D|nr:hypothetical protein [Shewanella halifaxensis]
MALAIVAVMVSKTLSYNTDVVKGIQEFDYPSLNISSLNKVLVDQASERFNIAVTIGDKELLDVNREVESQIYLGLDELQRLLPKEQGRGLNALDKKIRVFVIV